MEDSILRNMVVSGPRMFDGPMDSYSACHSPPPAPAASRANQRGARFKQHASAQPHMHHAESMPVPSAFHSRPIDDDALSDDGGALSPLSTAHSAAPYVIMQPSSPLSHTRNHAKQQSSAQMVTLRPASATGRELPLAAQPLAVTPYQRSSVDRSSKYRQDMRMAREGSSAMDRYKGLTQLFMFLRRDFDRLGVQAPYSSAVFDSPAHYDVLYKVGEVGEALSLFGTTDFGERSNSSRAITAKDYAYLLKMYCEAFWSLFKQDFLDALPQNIGDELMCVRGLLTTRFEANSIIADQLIKHVGLEAQGGGAVVFNTSVVSANPINRVVAAPMNHVKSMATAASKALHTSQNKLGAIALGAAGGLWLLKKVGVLGMLGIGGGRAATRLLDDGGDEGEVRGGRRGRGHSSLSTSEARLLQGFEHADRTWKELSKASHNTQLLEEDWRLGRLRLAAPFGGPHPPGYVAIDMDACDPRNFMRAQLGGA